MAKRFNNPTRNVVFSSFNLLEGVLDQERTGITWISLADRDLKAMTKIIVDAVKDTKVPKHIIITAMQKFVGGTPIKKLKESIKEISDAVRSQGMNKVVFSTANFVPAHERVWGAVALFNKEVQVANEALNMPRVNGHKAVMMPNSSLDMTRRVRLSQWLEPQLGTNVGNHLSYEGQENHVKFLMTVFDRAFSPYNHRPASRVPREQQPMSLAVTPGYCDDSFFRQVLTRKLIITKPLSPNEKILQCSNQRQPGWEDWEVFKKHGSLWRYWEKMGILEAYIKIMKQGNPIPTWVVTGSVAQEEGQDMVEEEVVERADVMIENVEVMDEQEDGQDDNHEDELGDEGEDDEVVFIQEVPAQERNDSRMDDEFSEPVRQVEFVENEDKTESENNKTERDCIESENLKEQVKKLKREKEIMEEKMKAYQRKNENLEARLAREKTTTKHWRSMLDIKRKEHNDLLKKMEDDHNHTKANLKRMTAEYEFLRNTYSTERRKQERLRATRRFVKDSDFDKFGKNHK